MMWNATQGPPKPKPSREELEQRKRAALWSAIWEASQVMNATEIGDFAERVLAEIETDEP
jgi:hypothetical protein